MGKAKELSIQKAQMVIDYHKLGEGDKKCKTYCMEWLQNCQELDASAR